MTKNNALIAACLNSLRLMCMYMAPIIIKAIQAAPIKLMLLQRPNNLGTVPKSALISSIPAIVLMMPALKSSAQVPPLAMIFSLD